MAINEREALRERSAQLRAVLDQLAKHSNAMTTHDQAIMWHLGDVARTQTAHGHHLHRAERLLRRAVKLAESLPCPKCEGQFTFSTLEGDWPETIGSRT